MSDTTPGNELFLIDGNSMAYRAFFALPDSMATSDGRPTNAIFGLASMLVKLIDEHHPRGVVVAWDAGMSGREETYPQYKAQRSAKPDLLSEQWPALLEMIEAFGYENISAEGYEADDVIASLVMQARRDEIPTIVVTGDRDAYQLVGDGVWVMTTSRGITDTKVYDRQGVIDRYGVPPELVTDLMGLRGDTSDNIPGVPGIGEKTAAALLEQFGSLESVLENVEQVSGAKRKENLANHAEDARVSKELATMKYDIPCDIDLKELMGGAPNRSRLREFMLEYELRAALERLEKALEGKEAIPGEMPSEEGREEVEIRVSEGDVLGLADGPVAVAASGAWAATDGERIVAGETPLPDLAAQMKGRGLIAHDAKSVGGFGTRAPSRNGLLAAAREAGEPIEIAHDTMLAAYVLEPARRSYDLNELAMAAGVPTSVGADDGQMSLDEEGGSGLGAAETAATVWALAERQKPLLEELGLMPLLDDIEIPLVEVLSAMEKAGVRLDVGRLAKIEEGMAVRIAELEAEVHRLAGREFTIGSPQQVGQVLFDELGLTRKRRGKTGYSTDARVLAQIRHEHEIVEKIEQWRELTKLKNTYLDSLPDVIDPATGRIHTTFNQAAASTGRLSSTNPNLQNIPIRTEVGRPVRGCFVAEEGNLLVSADYSQVELRILAHVADEEVLKDIFKRGEDVHTATAANVFQVPPEDVDVGQRSKAKMVNFGIVYGLTGFGLADRLNIPRKEGDEFVRAYLERFPAVRRFQEETVERASEDGFVTTLLGRRRPIPELRSNQPNTRRLGERLAVNSVIQGTAADIIKLAMIRCHRELPAQGLETRLVLQIHDELLFEGPAAEAERVERLARAEMCAAFALDPPLEVDVGIGKDWLDAK